LRFGELAKPKLRQKCPKKAAFDRSNTIGVAAPDWVAQNKSTGGLQSYRRSLFFGGTTGDSK